MSAVEAASVTTPAPGAPAADPAAKPTEAAAPPPKKKGPDPAKVAAILKEKSPGAVPAATPDKPVEEAKPPPKEPEGDPELAKRLARIAAAEDQARAVKKEADGLKTELGEYRAWKDARAKDPIGSALHGLTEDQQEEVYWRLNDVVLKRERKDPDSPEERERIAREAARKEIEEREKARDKERTEAREREAQEIQTQYVSRINEVFKAAPDKWPLVAARGVNAGDIHSFARDEFKRTGKAPSGQEVLDHFERKFTSEIEAAGYTRQKVEAQPGGERTQSDKPTTITAEWQSGAGSPPSEKPDGEKSRREIAEEIKRRRFKS